MAHASDHPAVNDLGALFPAADFQFRMTMRRGRPVDFFQPRDAALLRERARWVNEAPARYAQMMPGFDPLLAETSRLGESWGLRPVTNAIELAMSWEPDALLLSRDTDGAFRLRGGAGCFLTGWALAEKLGLTLNEIHGVVPGLNPAIGGAIDQFLGGLQPGVAFHRDNWGIAATQELNMHPSRGLAAPQLPVVLSRLWLRVEHQALVALPETRGVLFGIRIALHRLDAIAANEAVAAGLARALQTMPPALARYKRIEAVRDELIAMLKR